MNDNAQRYNGIAISFHWVIAALILGMLALGKYMVSLGDDDPTRFALIQWHKSFGIFAMVLIFCRLFWRATHKPPPPPDHLKTWETRAASTVHFLLYALIILIPVSGWIMVSASPLGLATVVFEWIPWPHLPPFDSLPNKEEISGRAVDFHELAGNLLILLLIGHIGAALRHHFMLNDGVMSRMSPRSPLGRWNSGFVSITIAITIALTALLVVGLNVSKTLPFTAGSSQVSFSFAVQGQKGQGTFPESTVELVLHPDNPAGNSLMATVNTTAVTAGVSQIDSTLTGSDWFDVKNFPQAVFTSRKIEAVGENRFAVDGTLQIKDISRDLSFMFDLTDADGKRNATGNFAINRLDFGLGASSQPDEENVAFLVTVFFEFEVQQ